MPGALLIGLAAALWATDTLVRVPSLRALDPLALVFLEHLFGLGILVSSGLALRGQAHHTLLQKLSRQQWAGLAFIGAGGSAIATVLFTASFKYVNPSVTILLQKTQPILAVIFSYLFLGERPGKAFYLWAALAIAAGILLSFPNLDFGFVPSARGVLYALTAAVLWAACTVAGRALLKSTPVWQVTVGRFGFGLATLGILILLRGQAVPWGQAPGFAVAYMALIPGVLAMVLYYRGLSTTPASTATLIELIFPVTAVLLNAYVLGFSLAPTQIAAGMVLLFSVTRLSQSQKGMLRLY